MSSSGFCSESGSENASCLRFDFETNGASAEKKHYPALICWYQQTGPAKFGQNHPPSSFSPHQAITATNQSWVYFFFLPMPHSIIRFYLTKIQPGHTVGQCLLGRGRFSCTLNNIWEKTSTCLYFFMFYGPI